MTEAELKITQEEKIAVLLQTVWGTYITVPFAVLLIIIFHFLGFLFELAPLLIIIFLALGLAFLLHYSIKNKWLVDQNYSYLVFVFLLVLTAAAIHFSGCVFSPVIWAGMFLVVYETINHSLAKGLAGSAFFIIYLWLMSLLKIALKVPHSHFIPGFHPEENQVLVIYFLFVYSLLYAMLPLIVNILAGKLRKEKRNAQVWAEEQKKAYRASVSMMEDLEAARSQLESKIKELEDGRRATLHLLQDVEQSREDAQQKAVEIAQLYEDLKMVDRMKTEFLSMISHELRTPMTPIKGYAEMLLSGLAGEISEPQKKAVSVIKKEGEHLLGLIDSILDVSRMERGVSMELKKEPISMKVLSDDLREVMEGELENRGIRLEIDLPPDFPTLIGDPSKLRRLLTNLLGNAIKFTPKGGWIRVVGTREDDTARIQIDDNGIGIAKENLEKIFDRFYQVDSSYTRAAGGVGLGLAIAKEIVESHGGKIWAESEGLGKGTRIIFTLPIGGR